MEGSTHPQNNPLLHGGGYEKEDLSVTGIMVLLGIIVVCVVIVHFVVRFSLNSLAATAAREDSQAMQQEVVPGVAKSRTYFPAPREQISPQRDLANLRAQEDAELSSYGWVDRKAGVARIPIQRAMELIGQRGLSPTWNNNGNVGPSSLQLQQQRPVRSSPPAREEGKERK